MATVAERLIALVDRSRMHQLWLGATDQHGVPQFRVDGRLTSARRVAWELERGLLPQGARVRACAADPRCMRVDHFTTTERRVQQPRVRRPRGDGSVREIRSGVWQLTFTTDAGERVFRTAPGGDGDAERELARLAAQHGQTPRTVDALVTVYLAHLTTRGRSPATVRRYEQLWRQWLSPTHGAEEPDMLRRDDIERALAAMHAAGQSERSIHQAAVVLNSAFAWACEQRTVKTNPVTGCQLPNGTTITATRHR